MPMSIYCWHILRVCTAIVADVTSVRRPSVRLSVVRPIVIFRKPGKVIMEHYIEFDTVPPSVPPSDSLVEIFWFKYKICSSR